jgi:5-methylthioadenosine/S-adenosylhomocysteine deaminase
MKDILITDGSILTDQGWIERGFIWLQNGKIASIDIGEPPQLIDNEPLVVIKAPYSAILPGLLNAHTHLSQTFMRGLAGGRPLIHWLKEIIWPMQNSISSEELYLAAALGLVENLRSGVTEVVNHHKLTRTPAHTEAVLRAAIQSGLRVVIARSWSDKGNNPESPGEIASDLNRLFELLPGNSRVSAANGPLALWRCSEETLKLTHEIAVKNNSFTHFHVAESSEEVRLSLEEYGLRPVEWLHQIGMLNRNTQIVHAVWIDDHEIELIARGKAPVIHCPVSNAVIGSGIAPVAKMLQHGIQLYLGSDGSASNDTQDLWETLKFAAALVAATTCNPTILTPKEALKLATGGKSLLPGQPADLIIVDLNNSHVVPVHNIDSALVLGTRSFDVKTVIVGGEILMQDRKVLALDEDVLLDECRTAIKSLRQRAAVS